MTDDVDWTVDKYDVVAISDHKVSPEVVCDHTHTHTHVTRDSH